MGGCFEEEPSTARSGQGVRPDTDDRDYHYASWERVEWLQSYSAAVIFERDRVTYRHLDA